MMRREDIKKLLFLSEKIRTKIMPLTHVDKPEGSRVLVIAPHPGDGAMGCGGTILLHRQLEHEVDVLYLTNGERGVHGMNTIKSAIVRKQEAKLGAATLHVDETHLHFLELPDGDLINHTGSNSEFRNILEQLHPDTIYLPSFMEQHRDHYAANVLLKNNLVFQCEISSFEIWTPLLPNRLVNITSVIMEKREALKEHISQLKELDYLEAIIGLNRYRAGLYNIHIQYAEAFITCPSEQYFELMMEVEI